MGLYKLFSHNVEIQYKSCLLSKATLFMMTTSLLNIMLPFIIAYRSRGFWLKSHSFYEQPVVSFTYEYLLVAETDDVSQPIVCSEASILDKNNDLGDENCAEFVVHEYDSNGDKKTDKLKIEFALNIPPNRSITSLILLLALDLKLMTVCPLQMQSLAVMDRDFTVPPSGLNFYGDLQLNQVSHLPCLKNVVDTQFNQSVFDMRKKNNRQNVVDFVLENYLNRDVTTHVKTLHSRSENGNTGQFHMKINLRIPEMQVWYIPSLFQELKWAWPQYLSLAIVFYFIFDKIKKFVFNNRLVLAWEVVPWKK